MTIYSLDVLLSQFGASPFHVQFCYFLTGIQVSQQSGKVVWYSHFLKNFPPFVGIHTVKCFGIVNKPKVDVFLEFCSFFCAPTDVGNLISGFSTFSKSTLNIWKFSVHVLLKPSLKDFEHYFASMWNECNCVVVSTFLWHCPSLGLEWKLTFSSLWPLLCFPNLLAYWVHHFHSIIF